MRFILVGDHTCHDIIGGKGRYHLKVYHDSLTRAVIEEREYAEETEWTATIGEWDRIGHSRYSMPAIAARSARYPKEAILRDVVHKLERAAPSE